MSSVGAIYIAGFILAFVAQLVLARSLHLVLINMAFWTALGWPLWVIGLALGFILKAVIPDKTD